MARKTLILVILIFLFVLSVNDVFGDWPSGWFCGHIQDSSNCQKSSAEKYTGTSSLKIFGDWRDSSGNQITDNYNQANSNMSTYYANSPSFPTIKNQKYLITFYAKTKQGQAPIRAILHQNDTNWTWIQPILETYVDTQWKKFSFEVTAQSSSSFLSFELLPEASGKTVYFDNLQVVQAGDLGFIDSTKQYLCSYYNVANPLAPYWSWFDAVDINNAFKIQTLGTIDIISGGTWNYCNATGRSLLNGNAIPAYGTFGITDELIQNSQAKCSDYCKSGWSGQINSARWDHICSDCGAGCCEDTSSLPPCCTTNSCGINNNLICHLQGTPISGGILKENCTNQNIFDCLGIGGGGDYTCQQITGRTDTKCNEDEACLGGYFVTSSDSQRCCVEGVCSEISELTCMDITNHESCSINQYCIGNRYQTTDSTLETPCCDYCTSTPIDFDFSKVNESFICYGENNKDLFAECCYGSKCYNAIRQESTLGTRQYIDSNAFTTGAPLYSLYTGDVSSNGIILDYVKLMINPTPTGPPYSRLIGQGQYDLGADLLLKNKDNWQGFDYLVFDIAYNKPNVSIVIIDQNNQEQVFPVSAYSINGDIAHRWHRIILNLSGLTINKTKIKAILFIPFYPTTTIAIDNVYLSTFNQNNIKNYYCTGLFGSWIDSLNPPANTNFNDLSSYGPYMMACNAQLSFAWTGTKCCGAGYEMNTSHKEYYNDTLAGCWGEFTVRNDQRVNDAINLLGVYQNVLFYGGSYYGCENVEMPTDAISTPNVVTLNYCNITGSYYCSHNEGNSWEKMVPGYKLVTEMTPEEKASLTTKDIPPGVNLLKNGGFDH